LDRPEVVSVNAEKRALQILKDFTRRMREFKPLLDTLVGDVELAHDKMDRSSQPDRRSYVRAVFALIEGTTTAMKVLLLETQKVTGIELTAGEYAVLSEQAYSLSRSGAVKERPWFLPIAHNVRFTFRMLERLHGAQLEIDYRGGHWNSFHKAVAVRNRLMHPRCVVDCDVSDDDLAAVDVALGLFEGASIAFLKAVMSQLEGNSEGLLSGLVRRLEVQ